jgi:predicted nucleotidyltransferase
MLTRDALTQRLRDVLAEDPGVRLALLFGSHAREQPRAGSDVDIAVDAPGVELLALAAKISERVGSEVDVVALGGVSIPMLERLVAESVVIHEGERGAAAGWRSRALAQLETDRPWYRRMRDAWLEHVAEHGLGDGR